MTTTEPTLLRCFADKGPDQQGRRHFWLFWKRDSAPSGVHAQVYFTDPVSFDHIQTFQSTGDDRKDHAEACALLGVEKRS